MAVFFRSNCSIYRGKQAYVQTYLSRKLPFQGASIDKRVDYVFIAYDHLVCLGAL